MLHVCQYAPPFTQYKQNKPSPLLSITAQQVATQQYFTFAPTFIPDNLHFSNLFSVSVPLITKLVYKQLPDEETSEEKQLEREILLPKK
jgi:hypothetical protein